MPALKRVGMHVVSFPARALADPWPAVIFAAALAVRALYLATVVGDPFFTYLEHIPDAHLFNNWAASIAAGKDLYGDQAFFIGPLYGYFLAVIYKIFGQNLFLVRVIHIILGAATAAFVYSTARRAFNKTAALIAGFAWAVFLPALFFESLVLPAALVCFLVSVGLYAAVVGLGENGKTWHFAVAGSALGLAVLDRGNLVLAVIAGAVLLAFVATRPRWRTVVAFVLPVVVLVAVTTVRNAVVARDFVPISSQGGVNFYIGNGPGAIGVYRTPFDISGRPETLNVTAATEIAEAATGREMKPSAVSNYWLARGLEQLRDNPWWGVRLYWQKLRLFANNLEVSLNADYYFMRFVTPFHLWVPPWFGLAFAFGLAGTILAFTERSPARWFLLVYAAAYALSVIAFFVTSRYRLPALPALVMLASGGAVWLVGLFVRRDWKAASVVSIVVIGGFLFSLWRLPGGDPEAGFAQSYYRYGKYYFEEGKYDEAVKYLAKATEHDPAYAPSYRLLGICYEERNLPNSALDAFEMAVALDPENPANNYNLGAAFNKRGRVDEAVFYLHRAVEKAPDRADYWRELGRAYTAAREYTSARTAYKRSLEIEPKNAEGWLRYAELSMQIGDEGEGVASAEKALELDPTLTGAHLLLGRHYLYKEDLGPAGEHLRAEVELAPGDPVVNYFLAEYYLAVGDTDAALAAYDVYRLGGGEPIEKLESLKEP
jgi:tetratricopeptide (TPR) repeat protein